MMRLSCGFLSSVRWSSIVDSPYPITLPSAAKGLSDLLAAVTHTDCHRGDC